MWIVIHTSTPDYLLQLRKEHDEKCWGIFRWSITSQTQTQDNLPCKQGLFFLNFDFLWTKFICLLHYPLEKGMATHSSILAWEIP